jgi:hypothetical protein
MRYFFIGAVMLCSMSATAMAQTAQSMNHVSPTSIAVAQPTTVIGGGGGGPPPVPPVALSSFSSGSPCSGSGTTLGIGTPYSGLGFGHESLDEDCKGDNITKDSFTIGQSYYKMFQETGDVRFRDLAFEYINATNGIFCSIPRVRENAPLLCRSATGAAVSMTSAPSRVVAQPVAAPLVRASPVHQVAMAINATPVVASPATPWYDHCPAGVPVSQCSRP